MWLVAVSYCSSMCMRTILENHVHKSSGLLSSIPGIAWLLHGPLGTFESEQYVASVPELVTAACTMQCNCSEQKQVLQLAGRGTQDMQLCAGVVLDPQEDPAITAVGYGLLGLCISSFW